MVLNRLFGFMYLFCHKICFTHQQMTKPKSWLLTDFLSRTHAQQLKASLYSYFNVQRPLSNVLPYGYHLIYFNPKNGEESLSKDGYDAHQQPDDDSFRRRLWASGEINFIRPVKFNNPGFCVETIDRLRKVGENQIASINREVIIDGDVSIEEKRTLIYTPSVYDPELPVKRINDIPDYSHYLQPTVLLLFRYSGLTFNSHKIHYNKEYALSEGYPDILVQGPLTVTLILEWISTLFDDITIKSFKYKNHSPIFANDGIRLNLLIKDETEWQVWIEGKDKTLHLSGKLIISNKNER